MALIGFSFCVLYRIAIEVMLCTSFRTANMSADLMLAIGQLYSV